jgi:hypothetical protein
LRHSALITSRRHSATLFHIPPPDYQIFNLKGGFYKFADDGIVVILILRLGKFVFNHPPFLFRNGMNVCAVKAI